MDSETTDKTRTDSNDNGVAQISPTAEPYTPTDTDLKNMFVKKQIETWGFEQVEAWYEDGFDLIVVNGKVLWVK